MIKVTMLSKNHCTIRDNDGIYLKSYDSIIAFRKNDGSIELDKKYWDYSNTTRKHRFEFLQEDSKTIKAKIASGTYKLVDLNK